MTKRCICEICMCGRHRCPHRPRATVGGTDKPCMLTEYATTYHQKPIQPRPSFKPDARVADSNAPMEDKTTQRLDYIKHAVERPFHHEPDAYRKPTGEHDLMTSYTKDYPQKRVDRAQAIRHETGKQVTSRFEGEPTYQSDYRKWDMGKPTRYGPAACWEPPKEKFEGQSTFTRDFRRYNEPPRQPLKPSGGAVMSDTPFDGTTGYRQDYIKHPLGARFVKEREKYKPNGVPIDGMTTFMRDYRGQPGEATKSCKPDGQAIASDKPFEDATTFKNDYRQWPAERPHQHQPDAYRRPEGDMDMNTTHKLQFKQHPLQRQAAVKPDGGRVMEPGAFEGVTNYTSDFRTWDINRVQPVQKPDYSPNDAPFEGLSTQKAHYVTHPMHLTQSCKPVQCAMQSGAFDDGTMYRMEYVKKQQEPCPAGLLETARAKYSYVEQDPRGHKFYQPIYTTLTNVNINGNSRVSSAKSLPPSHKPATPQQLPQLAVA